MLRIESHRGWQLRKDQSDTKVTQYLIFLCFFSVCILAPYQGSVNGQQILSGPGQETQIVDEDLVHFGDVIDIDVVGGFEFDWRGTLNTEGFLDGFDGYSEAIAGLCRSEAQIAADVELVLGRILREPKVVVRIVDRSNRALVRLDGAVRIATRFSLRRPTYLQELLVLAGGITDGASGDLIIFRPSNLSCRQTVIKATSAESTSNLPAKDNGSITKNIRISDLLSGKPDANPQILSGDIVTVSRALPIYVIGAVNNPRPIYSRDQMTLSRVVASAGGLAKDAEGNKVSIFRRDGVDIRSIEADLGKIKRGETNDEILRPFDIIEVATKGGGKRKYPPVVAIGEKSNRGIPEFALRIVD